MQKVYRKVHTRERQAEVCFTLIYMGNSTIADITFRLKFETLIFSTDKVWKGVVQFSIYEHVCAYWHVNWAVLFFQLTDFYERYRVTKHCRGRYIKNNHNIERISIKSKFLWSSRGFCMNCSKSDVQFSGCVKQKGCHSFQLNWHSQFCKGTWTTTLWML